MANLFRPHKPFQGGNKKGFMPVLCDILIRFLFVAKQSILLFTLEITEKGVGWS